MKVSDLLKNPLIKSIGIVLILYFGLFHDKTKSESLGNRLSMKNIQKNIGEVSQKTQFITANLKVAQDLDKSRKNLAERNRAIPSKQNSQAILEDLKIGSGERILSCGDLAKISYEFYTDNGQQISSVKSAPIIIGANLIPSIEQNIIGMKKGGMRNIKISSNSSTKDQSLLALMQFHKSDLKIQVVLHSFKKGEGLTITCN